MSLLELQGLAKRYGDSLVFEGVDLRLPAGELVAVVGDSGVGKSTLLNCIAGLDTLQAGRVVFEGRDLASLAEPEQASVRRARLGFVFQAFHVLPHLTVAQNVGLPLQLLKRHDPVEVERLLEAVGLGDLGLRMPRTLSGGQLQRVAIARALIHGPALVLADEPTGNLDPDTAERVLDVLVAQMRARHASGILVTHSQHAARRADRVLRLTAHGLVTELTD